MTLGQQDTSSRDIQVVFCTCPTQEVAQEIARALVEARLAACVNLLPGVISTYQWSGKVCHDEECLLLIKTSAACVPAVERCIHDRHPYELPEVLAVPSSGGSRAYLEWVSANVAVLEP